VQNVTFVYRPTLGQRRRARHRSWVGFWSLAEVIVSRGSHLTSLLAIVYKWHGMSGLDWSTRGAATLARDGAGTPRSTARLVTAVHAALGRAAELGCETGGGVGGELPALADALRRAADDLAAAISRRQPPASRAALVALLREVHELQCELHGRGAARRMRVIADARDAHERLRAAGDIDVLLHDTAEEACRGRRLGRCIVARVDGGDWVLAHAHFQDDPAAAQAYLGRLRHDRVSLERSPLESEMIRRRAAVLLDGDAAGQSIVATLDAPAPLTAHVACPVVVGDRVVAFLYAGGGDRGVDALDRDALRWFADGVAGLYERLVLIGRLRDQRDHVRQMASSATAVMTELCEADIELRTGARDDGAVSSTATTVFVAPERRLQSLLTRRELEVLALMAAGVSNAGVADRLVIAEGTVKSHVKHILRKLRAANRAEAVARYLHQYLGDPA
jgi:DNA-binding CsgD family transcriptional regulator